MQRKVCVIIREYSLTTQTQLMITRMYFPGGNNNTVITCSFFILFICFVIWLVRWVSCTCKMNVFMNSPMLVQMVLLCWLLFFVFCVHNFLFLMMSNFVSIYIIKSPLVLSHRRLDYYRDDSSCRARRSVSNMPATVYHYLYAKIWHDDATFS